MQARRLYQLACLYLHRFSRPSYLFALIVVLCASWAQPAWADALTIDSRVFVDPSRELALADILDLGTTGFELVKRSDINFGYTKSAIWLRLAIESEDDRTVLVSMQPNFVDFIDIYAGQLRPAPVAGDFSHAATGDHRPLPADGLTFLDDGVELRLRANEPALVYVRLAGVASPVTTDLQVYPMEDRPRLETLSILATGVWFGSMAILIVIQLIFFYYDRRLRYPLLALSTLMAALVYTGTLGLSRTFLFPWGGTGNDIFVGVTIWLGLTASTLAAIHILDLRENSPWLHRIFIGFGAMGVLGAIFAILGQHQLFAPYGNIASIMLATLGAFQGLRAANSGGNATRLTAAAYVVLWVGVVAVMVQRTALADLPNWVAHGYAVACVLQTVLLTAALGVRLRAAENLNLILHREALDAARAAEEHANLIVEERTRELAAARQTAEDALGAELASQQQQVRFMEVISHQYRTPLAAIRTHVDNIGLSLPMADDGNRHRLDRVRRGIARLVEVLEVNLARARFQGPAFRPQLARTPLADIVTAAAARGGDLLQKPIVIDVDPGATGATVSADADMLGVAIINLLENAVKFSTQAKSEVTLACGVAADQALIEVRDNGIGIPPSEIAGIFEPSARASNVSGVEGSGIGLSLVARIVHAHGGTVGAHSVLGQGTTIAIKLPLRQS